MIVDVLVIAAHPDDAEIEIGGTLLRLAAAGRRIGVIDVTRGERGSLGSVDIRKAEAAAAAERLGLVFRENLGVPDARVLSDIPTRERVAGLVRRSRPDLVFSHHPDDLHPDHAAVGELARQACYLSGLGKLREPGDRRDPHRPRRLMRFPGRSLARVSMIVDVSEHWEEKLRLVHCYRSQVGSAGGGVEQGRDDPLEILEGIEARGRYWGSLVGRRYGEPLEQEGPIVVDDPVGL